MKEEKLLLINKLLSIIPPRMTTKSKNQIEEEVKMISQKSKSMNLVLEPIRERAMKEGANMMRQYIIEKIHKIKKDIEYGV